MCACVWKLGKARDAEQKGCMKTIRVEVQWMAEHLSWACIDGSERRMWTRQFYHESEPRIATMSAVPERRKPKKNCCGLRLFLTVEEKSRPVSSFTPSESSAGHGALA